MTTLLIAVIIFAIQPAKAPPQRDAETNRTESTRNTKGAQRDQTQAAQPTPAPSQTPIVPEGQRNAVTANSHTQEGNEQRSDEDRATQKKLTWFTGVLAAVGVLQLVVMFLTWVVYRRQAHEMRRQRHETRRQRYVMVDQLEAMGEQLKEMQKQAGVVDKQAGLLEGQLKEMQKQAALTEGQLEEMRKAGQVTNKQVQHLINAERAWIQIPEIILSKGLSAVVPEINQFHIWVHPYIINNGRTQGKITKIIATTQILDKVEGQATPRPPMLPENPDYSSMSTVFKRTVILSPKEGINWINVPISVDDLEPIKTRQKFLYLYGQIDYTDISDTERYTRFGQIYWIPYGPSDSVFREGFFPSATIPPAYTECT